MKNLLLAVGLLLTWSVSAQDSADDGPKCPFGHDGSSNTAASNGDYDTSVRAQMTPRDAKDKGQSRLVAESPRLKHTSTAVGNDQPNG